MTTTTTAETMKALPCRVSVTKAQGDDTGRVFDFVGTTNRVDMVGDSVDPSGVVLDDYLRNPVVLLSHGWGGDSLPIARTNELRVEKDRIIFRVEFPTEDVSPLGARVAKLYAAGFMSAVSIGFNVLERKGAAITRWVLKELSCCAVPCNADALIEGRAAMPVVRHDKAPDAASESPERMAAWLAKSSGDAALRARVIELEAEVARLKIAATATATTETAAANGSATTATGAASATQETPVESGADAATDDEDDEELIEALASCGIEIDASDLDEEIDDDIEDDDDETENEEN